MKIREIISESLFGDEIGYEDETDMSSHADQVSPRAIKHLVKILTKYSVKTDALLSEVSSSLGEPFSKEDLEAANEQSEEVQELIDTADDDKVTLKGILDIKNDDHEAEEEKKSTTVSSMAARRANKGL
jgi:hypothetical protein